jgi:DnaJ-class molecular chaperone
MARNYYLILGVSLTASLEEIHKAYRRLVKASHPDISGIDSSARFREVQEAWETLGDAERRRAYDSDLKPAPPRPSGSPGFGIHRRRYSRPVATDPLEVFDTQPGGTYVSTARGQEIHFGLQMTVAEAATGGELPLRISVRARCPRCAGSGIPFIYLCPLCQGTGCCSQWRTIRFQVPAGLRNASVLEVPLTQFGFPRARLILHVEITPS